MGGEAADSRKSACVSVLRQRSMLAWPHAYKHLCTNNHLGVRKCNITCHKMTSELNVNLLIGYRRNQESCGKRAIM
uniref:Uncharacterized protein n=1 Tax=Prolemur simus TaxID=1328070 RepID=A0A8C8ZTJ0_PROSS